MEEKDADAGTENGRAAFEILGKFLVEDEWHPQRIEDKLVFRSSFSGKNGQFVCFFQVRADLEQLLAYAQAPVKVDEGRRYAVAEYVTRANYGLRIGNFEMDWSDGEVRYKSSIDFAGAPLTENLVRNTVYPAVQTMDRYLPGLMKVIYGSSEAAAAIKEIEGG